MSEQDDLKWLRDNMGETEKKLHDLAKEREEWARQERVHVQQVSIGNRKDSQHSYQRHVGPRPILDIPHPPTKAALELEAACEGLVEKPKTFIEQIKRMQKEMLEEMGKPVPIIAALEKAGKVRVRREADDEIKAGDTVECVDGGGCAVETGQRYVVEGV